MCINITNVHINISIHKVKTWVILVENIKSPALTTFDLPAKD